MGGVDARRVRPSPRTQGARCRIDQGHLESHAGGEFALPLADLFAAIGLTLEASEWDKLSTRGDVRFVPRGDSRGEFTNQGPMQEVATGEGLTLVVPETLSGDYITTPTSFSLKFEKGSALRGCKRVFVLICQDIMGFP